MLETETKTVAETTPSPIEAINPALVNREPGLGYPSADARLTLGELNNGLTETRGLDSYQPFKPDVSLRIEAEDDAEVRRLEQERLLQRERGAAGSFRASPVLLSVMSVCVLTVLA